MLVFNLHNNRSKKKAWMHEAYAWHLIHTDPFADTIPKCGPMGPISQYMNTSFGTNLNAQCPNGPNNTERQCQHLTL